MDPYRSSSSSLVKSKDKSTASKWLHALELLVIAVLFTVLFYKVFADPPSCTCDVVGTASGSKSSTTSSASTSGSNLLSASSGATFGGDDVAAIEARVKKLEDEGIPGVAGPFGPPGPPGPPGPQGIPGLDGKDGERGPRGFRGEQGIQGKTGTRGSAGSSGKDGANGYCAIYNATAGEVQVPCPDNGKEAADSETVQVLQGIVGALVRNGIISQVSAEQRVRFEGGSGLTHVRGYGGGSQAYHESSYTNVGFANFHNHADHKYTVGMGEVGAVLNGVEFWTRHNDYALKMPHATSDQYHATQNIEMPDVPPAVTAKENSCGNPPCINEQSEEMRRWFHAWQDQDPLCPSCQKLDDEREANNMTRFDAPGTVRDYTPYFKPVLCYMEGVWLTEQDNIEEPFASDRHFIDAKTWRELYDKNRFLYQSGRKSAAENVPYLPMSIRESGLNDSSPVLANWEYRILCHPQKRDIPLNRFRVASDLAVQLRGFGGGEAKTHAQMEQSRLARFELNPKDQDTFFEGQIGYQFIDHLMEEIPGKDNYQGNLYDESFGINATYYRERNKVLNTAYYSRFYSTAATDAMGRTTVRRGFNDPNLFAAMTTQEKVAGVTACTAEIIPDEEGPNTKCVLDNTHTQKWSWAVPLEFVYLTPLATWNPYNISICQGKCENKVGTWEGRDGGLTPDKAYRQASTTTYFYHTPAEFYGGESDGEVDPADTSGGVTGVLDQEGNVRRVVASGHTILFKDIVGFEKKIRQRYPIMPIHKHGDASWKEVKALQVLTFDDLSLNVGGTNALNAVKEERLGVHLKLSFTTSSQVGAHSHAVTLSGYDLETIAKDGAVSKSTSQDNGHVHEVVVTRTAVLDSSGVRTYKYDLLQCDEKVQQEDGSWNVRLCGDDTSKLDIRVANITSMNPWAFYTLPKETYDPATQVWKDSSGNGRDTVDSKGEPLVLQTAGKLPALRMNRQQWLQMPPQSIPDEFTVFARARYASGEGYKRRIFTRASNAGWFFGWYNGKVGATSFHRWVTSSQETVSPTDQFYVLAGRNTAAGPSVWRDGEIVSTRGGGSGNYTLAINKQDGSDMEITDVVVFDRHLSDDEVNRVSEILMEEIASPLPCCWDGHKSVSISTELV